MAAHRKSCGPPRAPVSSAMTTKVGVAARLSQSAAPSAATRGQRNARALIVMAQPSPRLVLVATLPPGAGLVAALRCAIEPRIHAPDGVEAARVGRISVKDGAVLARERAHARPLAQIGGAIGSAHGGVAPRAAA